MKKAIKKRILSTATACLFSLLPVFSQSVGLVLSGGGAKGAVHIGIIKALEENNIPIDYIAGTSIGAIVGSLYAMGYSPDEMLQLFLSKDFYYWQTGQIEEDYRFYFWKSAETPSFMRLDIPLNDSVNIRRGSLLPNSLVNPVQMNQAFMHLYAQANAQSQGNFDQLFIPFLCVASDVYNKQAIVFRNGDLGDAVRASMSFPLIFKPIIKDDIPLWDGGIYNNFPVAPMKEAWHPDFIIGSAVAGSLSRKPAEQSLYSQLENMVMQKTDYQVDPADGIMMRFNLADVGLLDFDKAQTLYDLGYNTTLEMLDSIQKRIPQRLSQQEISRRRTTYRNSLPPLIFKNVYISGTTEAQEAYIKSRIHRNDDHTFTFLDFKQTYFQLLMNPKINEIMPHAEYDAETHFFDLYLDIRIKNEITTAFGGNISSMNANQIYLGAGYQSLTELSATFNLDAQLGNAYNGFTFYGKLEIPAPIPLDVQALFSYDTRKFYESEKIFIDTDLYTFTNQRETFAKTGIGLPFLANAKTDILVGFGQLEDKYYPSKSYIGAGYDRSRYDLFNLGLYYHKNSLDTKQFPINGQQHKIYAQYISGKEKNYTARSKRFSEQIAQSYIQLQAVLNNYHTLSPHFNLGYLLEGTISSKNLWSNYTASILQAPGFTPTPHSQLIFNEAFHANQYLAAGLQPIFRLNTTFHLRGEFYGFLPIYPIKKGNDNRAYYGKIFSDPAYWTEISLIARLSFMNISLYANHYSYPRNSWNLGLNIGYLIFGPKFIQ